MKQFVIILAVYIMASSVAAQLNYPSSCCGGGGDRISITLIGMGNLTHQEVISK